MGEVSRIWEKFKEEKPYSKYIIVKNSDLILKIWLWDLGPMEMTIFMVFETIKYINTYANSFEN